MSDVLFLCMSSYIALLVGGSLALFRALRLYDGAGNIINDARVTDMGFSVGMEVVRKADDAQGKIISISPNTVELQMSSGVHTVSAESFIENKWKQHTPKQDPKALSEWWLSSPHVSLDFVAATVKARITISMQGQYDDFVKHEKSLEIFAKPSKDVQVKKTFAANTLRLPIASPRLEVRPASSKVTGGAVQLGSIQVSGSEDLVVHLVPTVQFPRDGSGGFVNPTWVMRVSTQRDDCNCEISGPKGWEKQYFKGSNSKILLPFVRNFDRVEKGDSLILHRPELAKTEAVETLVPVKKQRTS